MLLTTQTVLFYYYHLYGTLIYSKRLCRLADRGIAFNDIVRNVDSALLDIFLHRDTLKNVFASYEGLEGVMPRNDGVAGLGKICFKIINFCLIDNDIF